MAAVHPLQDLQGEARCSICLEYFQDPVSIDCGHSFCRACITQSWKGSDTIFPCPQCRALSQGRNLRPNSQLADTVQAAKQSALFTRKPQEENRSEKREKERKLRHGEDQKPAVCSLSRDQPSHTVGSIEEAAQEHKKTLLMHLEKMKMDWEQLQGWTTEERRRASELEEKLNAQRETVLNDFEEREKFLEQEKQQRLSELKREQDEKLRRIREKVADLEQQSCTLKDLITEIEKKCQETGMELLKDLQSCVKRCENVKILKPKEDSVVMENNLQIFSASRAYLQEKIKELKDFDRNEDLDSLFAQINETRRLHETLLCNIKGIAFKMDNRMYWSSTSEGVRGQNEKDATCLFQLCLKYSGKVEITDYQDKYLSLIQGVYLNNIEAVKSRKKRFTEFEVFYDNGKLRFMASNGLFLSRIYYVGNETHTVEAQKKAADVFTLFQLERDDP